ncbi:hypothetical protein [Mesorhizobium sp. M0830]
MRLEINIFSAAYGRDLKGDNNILPALGIERLAKADIENLCRKGF